jgi:hypothetical protein
LDIIEEIFWPLFVHLFSFSEHILSLQLWLSYRSQDHYLITFDVSLTPKTLFTPESMSWFSSPGAGGGAPSRLQPAVPSLMESRDAEAVVSRARLDARSIASKPAPVAKSWAHFVAGG